MESQEKKEERLVLSGIEGFNDDMNYVIAPLAIQKKKLKDSKGTFIWELVPKTYDDSSAFRFRKKYIND